MRILDSIKSKNELITLILFCIGMFLYAIGLSKLGGINAQTFFHIGGALFILCNYKRFSRADFKVLLIPLLCCIVLVILGLLTYFDTIMPPKSFGSLLKAVNSNIVNPFALFFLVFIFFFYTSRLYKYIFFVLLLFLIILICIASIIKFISSGFNLSPSALFYARGISFYSVWLLLLSALCISAFVVFKKHRWFFLLLIIFSLFIIIINVERSFIVAFIAMLFTPFFIWRYKNKAKILLGLIILAPILFYAVYCFSKDLPERYNVAHMIDNFAIVWNTPPIEMGKYDNNCFNGTKWLTCSNDSIKNGKSDIAWEHSSLARLAMWKSSWELIKEYPLKPRISGMWSVGEYLYHYYDKSSPNRIYIDKASNYIGAKFYGYPHIHNFILSTILEYGVLGLVAYIILVVFLCNKAYYRIYPRNIYFSNDFNKFIGISLVLFVMGFFIHTFFDVMFPLTKEVLFAILGYLLAFCINIFNAKKDY